MSSSSEHSLRQLLTQLHSHAHHTPAQTASLLSKAKLALLQLNALIPTPTTPATLLSLARSTLETGALLSIRAQDPVAFTRYYQQLQPFYELPGSRYHKGVAHGEGIDGQRSKVTGLYLLLLLTKGDYAGFHTLLESLEGSGMGGQHTDEGKGHAKDEGHKYIRYPVMLEQWLMEGAYDRVWEATRGKGAPSEEFGVFSEVCSPSCDV
jgi:26S proteasome regulatory subunit N12